MSKPAEYATLSAASMVPVEHPHRFQPLAFCTLALGLPLHLPTGPLPPSQGAPPSAEPSSLSRSRHSTLMISLAVSGLSLWKSRNKFYRPIGTRGHRIARSIRRASP